MSKTYLDRKNAEVPYVLISYSHRDKDDIERALAALNDKGADFWYDTLLNAGQDWLERVTQATQSKNCVGVVYFVSAEFVLSEACRSELAMLDELKKTHEKFDAAVVLLGETEEKSSYSEFINAALVTLITKHPNKGSEISESITKINEIFAKYDRQIYRSVGKPNIDDEEFIDRLFDEVFKAWGCASEEVEVIDSLYRDGLADGNYRVRTQKSRIAYDAVRGKNVEWKIFAYTGDTVSAILLSDELYAETCLSLADATLDDINAAVNFSVRDPKEESKKHLEFDAEFLACLKRDGKGRVLRYLKSTEREKYFLQLKEALEKVPVTDAADDGYFFVEGNKGEIMFADRGSDDVYRHVHIDAYASVFPVIDIDYTKYREYVLKNNKA